jgi:hypothetical protein
MTPLRIAGLATFAVLVAGCSASAPEPAAPPSAAVKTAAAAPPQAAQPRTEAAVTAVANEYLQAYAAQDYGAVWDGWTAAGKKAISRVDYPRIFQLCKDRGAGMAFQILKVTLSPDLSSATVRVQRFISLSTFTWVYEDGVWRFQPKPEAMALYALGSPEKIAAQAKTEGQCAGDRTLPPLPTPTP